MDDIDDQQKTIISVVLPFIALSVFVILICLPWLQFQFLNEDANNIALGFHPESLWKPELHSGRPLEALSYMLDAMIWDLNPLGYHLTNILLHLSVALLFSVFLIRLRVNAWIAALCVGMWAASTGPWSVMAFVFGRLEPLWLIPGLIALIIHLGPDELAKPPGGLRYLLILVLLALSFAAKVSSIMFWPVMIMIDLTFRRHRFSPPYRSYTLLGYLFSGFLFLILLTIKVNTYGWSGYGIEAHFSVGNWIFSNLILLMQSCFLPLSFENEILLQIAAFILSLILFFLNRKSWVGWGWFLLFILPILTMRKTQIWYTYVPSLALPLMLALAVGKLQLNIKGIVITFIALGILTFGIINDLKVRERRMFGTELKNHFIADLKEEQSFLLKHFIPCSYKGKNIRNSVVQIYNFPRIYKDWLVYPEAMGYIYINIILKQEMFNNTYSGGDEPVYVLTQPGEPTPRLPLELELKRRVFIEYKNGHFILLKKFTKDFSKIDLRKIKVINYDVNKNMELLNVENLIAYKDNDGISVQQDPEQSGIIYVNLSGKPNVIISVGFRIKQISEDPIPIDLALKRKNSKGWTFIKTKVPMPKNVWMERPIRSDRLGLIINPSPYTKIGLVVPPGTGCFKISDIYLDYFEV